MNFRHGIFSGYTDEDGILHEGGDLQRVKDLLEEGATLSYINRYTQQTALHEAAARGYNPIVKAILDKYPDAINLRGKGFHSKTTPLRTAIMNERRMTVKILLKHVCRLPNF